MADSLSKLCTICHINLPKYTCPRCSIRTCSLPCTKRHKLWSQCSGIRDPAAYLKRKELDTPAAFDKDFNFITGIERYLERADQLAEEKESIGVSDGVTSRGPLERQGVDIIWAPKGMTRHRQNRSRWLKSHKCINWSVEWVFPDGQKMISLCLGKCTIGNAFATTPFAKEHDLVKTAVKRPGKRRKVDPGLPVESQLHSPNDIEVEATKGSPEDQKEPNRTAAPKDSAISADKQNSNHRGNDGISDTPELDSEIHFYLHRPRTCVAIPVLIPVSPTETISGVLQGRKIIEFPTFYVLSHSADKPAEDEYMLEEDYLKQYGAEEGAAETQLYEAGEDANENIRKAAEKLENVDESKLLEVLNKDLVSIK